MWGSGLISKLCEVCCRPLFAFRSLSFDHCIIYPSHWLFVMFKVLLSSVCIMREYYICTPTSGTRTAYPSGSTEFIPVFIRVRVTGSLVLCVCFVDRCLSFYPFLAILLSVLRLTDSDYPLWYLQTLRTWIKHLLCS